jgi:phage protein U
LHFFFFFSLSKVQDNNLWSLLNKEKEKRGKRQMVGMGEEKIGMEK